MASPSHGNAIVIEKDSQFQQQIDQAGNRLVVVDFNASWCGPCRMMAPIFANLSVKYSAAVFLTVDVDKCKRTAATQGIRAMPTFFFYKNRKKVDEMQGANPTGLEDRINQWIGGAVEPDNVTVDPKRVATGRSWDCFEQLLDNPAEVFMDASQLLLKFAFNIINNPDNPKYRTIRVGNKIFQSRLLPVNGAVECLFAVGFQERGDQLVCPPGELLENMLILQDTLNDEQSRRSGAQAPGPTAKPTTTRDNQPPGIVPGCSQPSIVSKPASSSSDKEKDFLLRLQSSLQHVLLYEDPDLQRRAYNMIPVAELKEKPRRPVKKQGREERWVDKPSCPSCGSLTFPVGVVPPTPEEMSWGAGNVESYKCQNCGKKPAWEGVASGPTVSHYAAEL
ncbi:Peptide-N(4)-(N-acetyl-beta- glucosaminyl)asparagine amidase [Desmophyllum pertusum]|uniref:Peptide-N(4)-(N-acetyl-beta-glucosaminyl)asparagine amidase n=1 Tax=Desmophyllum pertusum TaxID=174260 RepID=A0A9X0CZS3_9CNID|nr:Peptide-N(4)-(N-acetyl-beta- glucosaminyl)asparagine amidase [Desmophyllum pertusum]